MRFVGLFLIALCAFAPAAEDTIASRAYRYASEPRGPASLGLTRRDATAFAEKVAAMSNAEEYFAQHQRAFRYAYTDHGADGEYGLAMPAREALAFADNVAGQPDGHDYLKFHQTALRWGMKRLDPAAARTFTRNLFSGSDWRELRALPEYHFERLLAPPPFVKAPKQPRGVPAKLLPAMPKFPPLWSSCKRLLDALNPRTFSFRTKVGIGIAAAAASSGGLAYLIHHFHEKDDQAAIEEADKLANPTRAFFIEAIKSTDDGGLGMAPRKALPFAKTMAEKKDAQKNFEAIQAAFRYAYTEANGKGMNQSYDDAMKFVEETAAQPSPAEYLKRHTAAFNHAYRNMGMNMYFTGAKAWADEVARRPDSEAYLDRHEKLFRYAYRAEGTNNYWKGAKAWADKTADRADWKDYLDRHRDAFNYAYKNHPNGSIAMYWNDALAFADKVAERPNAKEYVARHRKAYRFAYFDDKTDGGCLNHSQSEAIKLADELADRPDLDAYIENYRSAFSYAYKKENDGMNLSWTQAKEFADQAVKKANPRVYVQRHKDVAKFFYKTIDMSWMDAKKMTDELADRADAEIYVDHYKVAFDYAYKKEDGGMNPPFAAAKEFAKKLADRGGNVADLVRRHKEAYQHAYKSKKEGGLGEWGTGAKSYADKETGLD